MSMLAQREATSLELLLMKLHSTVKRGELEKEFNSTSPYAVTTKQPTSRIVDNAITKGDWHTSPVHSSVSRGFFGGVKDVRVSGGDGRGSIDTKVQFDEIFKCPVTGREFLQKDLDQYKHNLRREVDDYVTEKLKTAAVESSPMTLDIRIATDGMIFNIPEEAIEKLLSRELEGLEFARVLAKYKEKQS